MHKKYTELEQEHQVQGRRFDEANKAESHRQAYPVGDDGSEKERIDRILSKNFDKKL
ncbi:hypothetical protein RZQ20_25555 [Raoultella ornithinolytica]|uniref:hypothetical protein n=1 Tax=Raoultella ornithinolytica TaxID=54291 RepID=UPI00255AAB26|nr:hypothetical protein [Raoultella ornithinolytica]MDL4585334.1 hypothetical protein [Raoultella ornithinolytica]MDV1095632.1 hypothetical protein [Raoultella ornithinolytica]MDV1123183.1 hypothetical protein [Raoultella ornithinolytica]MDV1893543.1 hypothetical protein [Raoultella ornithinolytica]HEC2564898.1 hypothetical protein [Raoultella ornithinolytica]